MATLLKAAPISKEIVDHLTQECSQLKDKGVTPNLKVILVGEHAPSVIYTRNKKKFMEGIGASCEIIRLPEDVEEKEFLETLNIQAKDPQVHGLFVQLPLPKKLGHLDVGQLVPPEKDVDGFHAVNLYGLMSGDSGDRFLIPCTPKGVLTMLRHAGVELSGKKVAIIGRSLIVGKPLALLLTNQNATVTLCHSRTKDLEKVTQDADIIVAAIGKAKFITKKYLKESGDQILIDVGINHDEQGKLCGDIDQADVESHCDILTPVPGGVGKMTIVSLGQNLVAATKRQSEEE
ncbi:MAG: bifunctional 5,10-methylenetetrahydrofolate dehydrogenase/5,10-methenyltetrahydrofolate cyclohydrolase [Halobacteriovoraceae bacterium]|nr:bifunctional 5,10-methylenetetrahydrofolate dehydrogenase/5,10-methenyltetrahydrofolate cyclohydrolase [Halobacteriovoraceae bacterium]